MADYVETTNVIGLEKLAQLLMSGRKVLFITGAGLSVSSGISTYRASKDAIWDRFITSWGTRKKFREDPLRWWNEFWLQTHEKNEFLQAQPNAGHFAISHIIHRCNAHIITQNIDRLHAFTLKAKNDCLAEVHGRLGLYKCITPNCRFTYDESITGQDVDLDELVVEGTSMAEGNLQLREPPVCPDCQQPVLPQSLLFDELYESHSHYNWDKCLTWMEEAEVFIFIGTSFSVGITAEAIDIAEKQKKIVFNFNLQEEFFDCETYNIIGKSEETLPRLYNFMMILAGKPRLYFYPMLDGSYGIPPGSRYSAFKYSLKL